MAAFSRARSVDREQSESSFLPSSTIEKSKNVLVTSNKATLPLPIPVVNRRHSSKPADHSLRTVISSPRSTVPVVARPPSAAQSSLSTAQPSKEKLFGSPVAKEPVVLTRPRIYTTITEQFVSRSDRQGPSDTIVSLLEVPPTQHPATSFDKNLKKFHTWCTHCKRVQRAASVSPVVNKGLSEGISLLSEENSPTVRNIRELSVDVRNNSGFKGSTRPSSKSFPSSGCAPSDLSLRCPVVQRKQRTALVLPRQQTVHAPSRKTLLSVDVKERPQSACTSLKHSPVHVVADHTRFRSLFDFDNLSAEQMDLTWMNSDDDPLDTYDDFYYDSDIETVSVKSEGSIVVCCITCDTKLKDDTEEDYPKLSLRKTLSNNC